MEKIGGEHLGSKTDSQRMEGKRRFNELPSRTKLQTACEQGSLWLIECSLQIINI